MGDDLKDPDPGFGYIAFGSYLVSNRPVAGLTACANSGLPELQLCLGELPPGFDPALFPDVWHESSYRTPSGSPLLMIYASHDAEPAYWFKYDDKTNIVVDRAVSRIWVVWPEDSCLEEALTYVLGPVMAIVAQLRGAVCLHGSAVVVDGSVIGLLGPQGAGKSTSAAAFAQAGYAIAADDIILLVEHGNGFLAEPAYPVLRLWPSSVEFLFGHENALPKLSPTWDKRGLNLIRDGYRYQETALPLSALFVLGERSPDPSAPYIESLSGSAALLQLVSNSWAHYAEKPSMLANQFRVLSRLAERIPIRQVTPSSDSARLPDLCRLLVGQVRASATLEITP